ncbi:MAG: glycosyltransferase [Planctomycetaceae bacterium]|jgi:cellulose synthase/poly-beta-1,6-N-acetylglucosamine synthase-like glycosyltransferase|nr:glycosyltransferase [Planctomycetaceae bacterium]
MHVEISIFWICVLLITYTYLFYPLAIRLFACLRGSSRIEEGVTLPSVSFVIAARNEGERIAERVAELVQQLDNSQVEGEVILVVDGPGHITCTKRLEDLERVHVLQLSENRGKAAAISEGANLAKHEVLAFADVRQRWQEDALQRLLESFRDPQVGAVSGDLVLQSTDGVLQGVGLYWKYEKWIRRNEAMFDSVVGVTGAICAVRRHLFHGVPAGTILDDVYWPMRVILQGYRVAHNPRAVAFDRLPEKPQAELRRKIRTLSGNFQLVALLPAVVSPRRNRLWWQFVSHKLMRLAVPWLLLAVLLLGFAIDQGVYRILSWIQVVAGGAVLVGVRSDFVGRTRLGSAVASFVMLNVAAWLAFWVWISGRAGKSWNSTHYEPLHSSADRA